MTRIMLWYLMAVGTADPAAPGGGRPADPAPLQLRFDASGDFNLWQQTLRRRLVEILALTAPPYCPLAATRKRETQTEQ